MAEISFDAIIIGAGPNGMSAAIQLADHGLSVCVYEANEQIGGGARTEQLTLPGFHHDVCSAIHPMAMISPFFKSIPLQQHGLEWINPPVALAHPFDGEPAAFLSQSLDMTSEDLREDSQNYLAFMNTFLKDGDVLLREILKPIRVPKHPFLLFRFGMTAIRSASSVAKSNFKTGRARALFAGCSAHSMVALDKLATASFGITLSMVAHMAGWPIIKGGSQKIVDALEQHFKNLGGELRTNQKISSLKMLPRSKAILMALTPKQVSAISADELPSGFHKKLSHFRYGPGVFKMDWALDGPIPWKDPTCRRAGTVHVGCMFEEILRSESDMWNGRIPTKPFVIVAQQSLFDASRAPSGKHTGWAYCHVPHGCTKNMSEEIESQIERFAPGFRDLILARHIMNPIHLQQHNGNVIGGDIGGGANNLVQFLARPMIKWNPYTTPNPQIFICSSSTSPGAGVHGMCGYHAANSVLKKIFQKSV